MKFLKFLLISAFLVMFSGSAYALNFGIDLDGNGLDFGYSDEVGETGYGAVALSLDTLSGIEADGLALGDTGSFSGTFEELAGGYLTVLDGGALNVEMTYLLSATGNFSVDYEVTAGGTVLTNHAFGFSTGIMDVYLDDSREWSYSAEAAPVDNTFFYESNDGTNVATFELTNGTGALQGLGQATSESIDIWALSDDINPDIFFFEGGIDFHDVVLPSNIFVQMSVNTSNEENPNDESAFLTEVQDAVESNLFQASGEYDFLVAVETDGTIEFNVVPEPTTMLLFGLGLLGFAGIGRRKNS